MDNECDGRLYFKDLESLVYNIKENDWDIAAKKIELDELEKEINNVFRQIIELDKKNPTYKL